MHNCNRLIPLFVTLHRKTGKKVNARARQNGTQNNRQCAKWHGGCRAASQRGHEGCARICNKIHFETCHLLKS